MSHTTGYRNLTTLKAEHRPHRAFKLSQHMSPQRSTGVSGLALPTSVTTHPSIPQIFYEDVLDVPIKELAG